MQPVAMRVWTSTISGSTTTYSYDGEGSTLSYGLDRAGRMRSVAGVLGGQTTNYASQASYEAHGGLKSVALGKEDDVR